MSMTQKMSMIFENFRRKKTEQEKEKEKEKLLYLYLKNAFFLAKLYHEPTTYFSNPLNP